MLRSDPPAVPAVEGGASVVEGGGAAPIAAPPAPGVARGLTGARPRALSRGVGLALLAAVGVGLLIVPFFASGYVLKFLTEMFMLITMAVAWNIIGGLVGYASFGHVMFFGLGAYTSGLLITRVGLPLPLGLAAAVVVAVLFALVLGVPILRLRGHYFAIATFGVAEALRQVAMAASGLTEGGKGVNVPFVRPPEPLRDLFGSNVVATGALFYYLMLLLLAAAVLTTWLILRSRLGYGLRAIRADEDAAATLGIDCTRYKVAAFAISAIFPVLAGALYASWINYIDPITVFNVDYSVNMVIMALLGGVGTLWGPVVGGVLLWTVAEALWGHFLELHTAFLGLVLVLTVVFIPRGVLDAFRNGLRRPSLASVRQSLRRYSV